MKGGVLSLGSIGLVLAGAACGSSPGSGGDGGSGGVVVLATGSGGHAASSGHGGHQAGSSSATGTSPDATCDAFGSRGPGCCNDGVPNCSSQSSDWKAYCEDFISCPNGLPACFSATDCKSILACAMIHGC